MREGALDLFHLGCSKAWVVCPDHVVRSLLPGSFRRCLCWAHSRRVICLVWGEVGGGRGSERGGASLWFVLLTCCWAGRGVEGVQEQAD